LVLEKKIVQQKQSLSKNNLTNASEFNILGKYATISLTFCQVFFCLDTIQIKKGGLFFLSPPYIVFYNLEHLTVSN